MESSIFQLQQENANLNASLEEERRRSEILRKLSKDSELASSD